MHATASCIWCVFCYVVFKILLADKGQLCIRTSLARPFPWRRAQRAGRIDSARLSHEWCEWNSWPSRERQGNSCIHATRGDNRRRDEGGRGGGGRVAVVWPFFFFFFFFFFSLSLPPSPSPFAHYRLFT